MSRKVRMISRNERAGTAQIVVCEKDQHLVTRSTTLHVTVDKKGDMTTKSGGTIKAEELV